MIDMACLLNPIDQLHHEVYEASRTWRVAAKRRWLQRPRDARRELADAIEADVRARLEMEGYFCQAQRHKAHFDLLCNGVRVEVKAARWYGERYQFNLRDNDADVVVMACVDEIAELDWNSVVNFVVPFAEVRGLTVIKITQRDPGLYTGKLAGWIERWDVIDQLVAKGCNQWQMALPLHRQE